VWSLSSERLCSTDLEQKMPFVAVCCPNGTYGMDCAECAGGRAQPCNGNGQCVVSISRSLTYNVVFTGDHFLGLRMIKCTWIFSLIFLIISILAQKFPYTVVTR